MILFISTSGESLPLVWRMKKEASIYIHNPLYRSNYKGILDLVPLSALRRTVKKADMIVFDISRVNERTKQDIALLKMFGANPKSPTVYGPVADLLRKDKRVIGASSMSEILEMDRRAGTEFAKKSGLKIPASYEFTTVQDGVDFLKSARGLWVLKPLNNGDLDMTYVESFAGELLAKLKGEYKNRLKGDYLLQKKINGTELSTEVWIDKTPLHYNHTLECKRLMCGDLGPAIGSQSNTVFMSKGFLNTPLAKAAQSLHDQSGYVGPLDANCIVSEGIPYFLEWSPRLGWDAFYNLMNLYEGSIVDFFNKLTGSFKQGFSCSQRLSIPPYPYAEGDLLNNYAHEVLIDEDLAKTQAFWAQDVYYDGQYRVAGSDGIVGVMSGVGESIGAAYGKVYRRLDKFKIASYKQYRTDGAKKHEARYNELVKMKVV